MQMDWLERMNGAIAYIEEHLAEEMDYEAAARAACCSVYHFQRMFSFITDIPISEYIRRRRLTLAAYELQNTPVRIIDVALKYGYDSHEAFSRAFQRLHGVPPSIARSKGVKLKAYPRMSFHIMIKGDVEMDYRIEEAPAGCLFGRSIEVSLKDEQYFRAINDFVGQSWQNGLRESIRQAAGYGPKGPQSTKLLGTALYDFQADGSFRFMLTAECPGDSVPEDFEALEVPASVWAVFSTSCSEDEELDTMTKIWRRIPEWFQATSYEHRPDAPELEKCYRTPGGYMAEVWIPVISK
jgi:AraC family transcriptional regulator